MTLEAFVLVTCLECLGGACGGISVSGGRWGGCEEEEGAMRDNSETTQGRLVDCAEVFEFQRKQEVEVRGGLYAGRDNTQVF